MEKVSLGIPCYGAQEAKWWSQLTKNVAQLSRTVQLGEILVSDSMATDHNRNLIVENFLKTDSDWLFWIDADTTVPIGSIERLLSTGKKFISGLYYAKHPPHNPIAYYKNGDTSYKSINTDNSWERGEILEVESVGFGCMLTHRSIFEDIKKAYVVKQIVGSGMTLIHKDDISESLPKLQPGLHGNILSQQVIDPEFEPKFPFFALEFGRTEDIWFTEKAKRVGYKVYVDTSIECGHLYPNETTGKTYRDLYGY